MGDISKHFSTYELECRCRCGLCRPMPALLSILDKIREYIGKPLHINSGLRCTAHNKNTNPKTQTSAPVRGGIGTAQDSAHTRGEAADIYVSGWSNRRLGETIRDMYEQGLIPELTYCYKIEGSTGTAVHVGVDQRKRKSVFGW